MKKFIHLSFLLILISSIAFSESYRINDVTYDITGLTRQYALTQKVPVDTNRIFYDKDSFDNYITNIRQLLTNQRVFQSTDVTVTFLEPDENGLILADLLITTVDTLNIIGVPYPSYNSNTGIKLKIKVKDYNFFGSMETMNFDLNYQAKGTDNLDDVQHIYGLNFGFSVPFALFSLPSSWNSDFSFSYTVGNPHLDMTICEGISTSIPLFNVLSANLSFNQYYVMDSEYFSIHDDNYFKEEMSLSLPLNLYTTPNSADIYWKPSVDFSYIWDFDIFNHEQYSGIKTESLRGPVLSLSHAFYADRINWLGNSRDGFSFSINNSYNFNLYNDSLSIKLILDSQYHKKFNSFISLSSHQYWYKDFTGYTAYFGDQLRGIRDNDWKSNDYVLLNFDFPISLFQTDWGNLFGWDKLNFLNFEFVFSPFFDTAFGNNMYAGSNYNLKDGWYGTGFECIIYPERFRSIQGRISFGLDAVLLLENKAGKEFTSKLFNTGWRAASSSWYELSIGIGLFY